VSVTLVPPLLELAQQRRLRHVLQPVELAAPADRVDHTSSRASRARAATSSRPAIVWKNPVFTSARIDEAIASNVV
jgi:hypothetical protein